MNRSGKQRFVSILIVACGLCQVAGLVLYGTQFLVSVFGVQTKTSWMFHELAEVSAFLALILGTVLAIIVIAGMVRRQEKLESKIEAASLRFQDVIVEQFDAWGFTQAEAEVGMLMIKGMSIAEIADLRGRSQATVKAQNTAIYQKSGMANRSQLVSYFVEELTSGT